MGGQGGLYEKAAAAAGLSEEDLVQTVERLRIAWGVEDTPENALAARRALEAVAGGAGVRQLETHTPVRELGLPERATKALWSGGVRTLGDLLEQSAEELLFFKNLGERSVVDIRRRLGELGLSLSSGGRPRPR